VIAARSVCRVLIAEDLLLLLLDDESGAPQTSNLATALGGATLVELALGRLVEVRERQRRWSTAKVVVVPGATSPADPVLAAAFATVGAKERRAQDLVGRLGKGLTEKLAGRLVDQGVLTRRSDRLLGVFPRTRWPMVDASREEDLRRSLGAALVHGQEPDQRTAALIALLAAVDRAHKVVDREGRSAREVRRRAKKIAEGDWAAKAVRDAVAAATAAVVVVLAAGAGAAAGSGS
jgi:hypothetical protein